MKYLWVLVAILAVVAGTVAGEVSRKASYLWVDSHNASLQTLGAGATELRCKHGSCVVCFGTKNVALLRDNICHSTPGASLFQPFAASLLTASVLLGFWGLARKRQAKPPPAPTSKPA